MSKSQPVVTGHLDGLRGISIDGWAYGHSGACKISAVDERGVIVASGFAEMERPDLLCLGQGKCNFAFRLPLQVSDRSTRIHVMADGVEIANSPIAIGAGHFDGIFETRHGVVDGWVSERRLGGAPPSVTIFDQDGILVCLMQSVRDTSAAEDTEPRARFTGKLDLRCFGAGELRLSAYANGAKFAEASCNIGLNGNIETLLPNRCSGWLLSTDAPAHPLEIEIFRDGERVATARCNISRADVRASYPGTQASGFSCVLPQVRSSSMDFTTLSFRFAQSNRELFEGPFLIANRPAIVEAARAAARMTRSLGNDGPCHALSVVLRSAIDDFLAKSRQSESAVFRRAFPAKREELGRVKISVIIPIYRGVEITRACIDSVVRTRSVAEHRIILVHDHSPEVEMTTMLQSYLREANLYLLNNDSNLGFIRSVNRALAFTADEDVVLLNSDTLMFSGALDCLWRVAHGAHDIGTVTAMSNNATIFSYPHYSRRRDRLDDIEWEELAATALELNGDLCVDVPSGHGFCMLVRRTVLDCLGSLDESFGRGYGEENDFCSRAADLGFRNVAAAGVIVEHRESTSFLDEKHALLTRNLAMLEARYPEYTPTVIEVERRDDLRIARWALDGQRLCRASAAGARFALVVSHKLGGGTSRAIADIEALVGYGEAEKISLTCRTDGYVEVECAIPLVHAVFSPLENDNLRMLLGSATLCLVVMHQVLGFSEGFVRMLAGQLAGVRSVFYGHDFYGFCPRVTMIDATQQFCNQASVDVCCRCVKLGGSHASSRLDDLDPAQHRALFAEFLRGFTHVVTPSANAAGYFQAAFPGLVVEALPHPWRHDRAWPGLRPGCDRVVMFGAIGPHKGSAKLLEIAQLARLTAPGLRFTVVGYTDVDEELLRVGNVSITGAYSAESVGRIVSELDSRLALFLSAWPETYSYTLTEAVSFGFFPLVPDIGAPAERVRTSGFGAVFSFPIVASEVIALLEALQQSNAAELCVGRSSLLDEASARASIRRTGVLFGLSNPSASIPSAGNPERLDAIAEDEIAHGAMESESIRCVRIATSRSRETAAS